MLKETGDGSDCESSGCRDEGVSGNDANEYSVKAFLQDTNSLPQSFHTQGQVGPVLSFLMQWSKLRYCLEEFRFQPDKRDIVEWKALANSFFLVNRERRALLDRDARGDALIAQMRAAEKEQKKSASSGAAVARR